MIIQLHKPMGIKEINSDNYSDEELEKMGLLEMVLQSPERKQADIEKVIDATAVFTAEQKTALKAIIGILVRTDGSGVL